MPFASTRNLPHPPWRVALLGLLLASCASHASSPVEGSATGDRAADGRTCATIRSALRSRDPGALSVLHVLCRDGLVIIAGALPSDYVLAPLAVHIARTTRGVRRVETYFTPRPAADTGDSALTEKIRGALAREGTAGVVGTDVAVVAGTAVLVGTADDEAHADHLVASAGAVDGIKSVKSFIQLRP